MGLLRSIVEVVSPVRCAGCGLPGSALCEACRRDLPRIRRAVACPRCGAEKHGGTCVECAGRDFAFSAAVCAGRLEAPLSRAVTLYKDAGERRYAALLGEMLAAACAGWRGWPDAVCAVPPTGSALSRRGFDHTAALAREVAHAFETQVVTALDALGRDDQRALGRDARFANMACAFRVRAAAAVPARILLVDDVFTTGATLDGAARALLVAGASEVRVAAVARA